MLPLPLPAPRNFPGNDDEVALRGDEAALRLWEDLCGDAAPARFDADDLERGDEALAAGELLGSVAAAARSLSKFRLFSGRA